MRLSPPKQVTFAIGGILWLVGLLGLFVPELRSADTGLPISYGYCAALLGGLVIVLGNILDNL